MARPRSGYASGVLDPNHPSTATGVAEDLMELVLRAGRLGFSRQRVATALGIDPAGVAVIEQRAEEATDRDGVSAPTG